MEGFALWLINQLYERRWTQRHFARRADLSHATVNKLVNGRETDPRISTVARLIAVLGQPATILSHFGIRLDPGKWKAETKEIAMGCERLPDEERRYLLGVVQFFLQIHALQEDEEVT